MLAQYLKKGFCGAGFQPALYLETTMTLVLTIVGWTLFAIAILIGLALNLIGLFGNWVILGSIAAVWAITGFQHFSWWAMLLLLALASLGELLELLAAGYGAARYGGGRGAAIASLAGCIVGAIVGTPWFPLVGTLAGAIVGAFAGALLYEFGVSGKSAEDSFRTGIGAALGRVGGVVAKLTVGFAMLLVAFLSY
jgi:uncharacterized protein